MSNAEKWQLIDDIVNNPQVARQLSGADLSDANLRGAILTSADLRGANLRGAILTSADLRGIDLIDTGFRNADHCARRHRHIDISDLLNFLNLFDRPYIFDLLAPRDSDCLLACLDDLFDLHDRIDLIDRVGGLNLRDRLAIRDHLCYFSDFDLRNFLDLIDGLIVFQDRLNCSANLEGADLTDTIVEGCQFGDGIGLDTFQKADLKRRGGIFKDAPSDRNAVETPTPTRR